MKKYISSFCLLLVGVTIGWWANDLLSLPKEIIHVKVEEKQLEQGESELDTESDAHSSLVPELRLDHQLLSNPQFNKLIELFKSNMTLADKEQLDSELIQHATVLVSRPEKQVDVESQLITLSNIESIQTQVLPILIKYYQRSKQTKLAIEQLFKLRGLLSFDADFKNITRQIKIFTREEVSRLTHANQKEKLASFYEYMLFLEPDNYELQMQFALFEYDRRHYDSALRLLSILVYHPDLDEQALKLVQRTQQQLNQKNLDNVLVPVEKRGEQYIVTALINDLEPVKLMLDTGASMTILSPEIVNSLDIFDEDSQQAIRFSTANGDVVAPMVYIDKIDMLGHVVTDVQVGVLPSFPIGTIDGLLGMNFLGQFAFFIDQENLVLQLRRLE